MPRRHIPPLQLHTHQSTNAFPAIHSHAKHSSHTLTRTYTRAGHTIPSACHRQQLQGTLSLVARTSVQCDACTDAHSNADLNPVHFSRRSNDEHIYPPGYSVAYCCGVAYTIFYSNARSVILNWIYSSASIAAVCKLKPSK